MRRIPLVIGLVVMAAVLVSLPTGYWLLRGRQSAGGPQGELIFTRQVEINKVSSENGIEPIAVIPSDLYVVSVDGSKRRLLARNAAEAAVSPDGRSIAFTRDRAVWTMWRDGSGAKRIVRNASTPAWSPDGRTIYFSRWVGSDLGTSIFSIRDDGTHLLRLTRAKGQPAEDQWRGQGCFQYHEHPSPSPDGRALVYTDEPNACSWGTDIRAVSRDGRPLRVPFRLLAGGTDPTWNHAPAWSPDGRQLAYVGGTSAGNPAGLYISRADGSATGWIVDGRDPAWSPDGKWIAFDSSSPPGRYPPNGGIELIWRNGTHRQTVTQPALCADLSAENASLPRSRCVSFYDPAWLPSAAA